MLRDFDEFHRIYNNVVDKMASLPSINHYRMIEAVISSGIKWDFNKTVSNQNEDVILKLNELL